MLATKGTVLLAGEISSSYEPDVPGPAEGVVERIGYDPKDFLFDALIHRQSPDIAQGVQTSREKRGNPAAEEEWSMGAGDQGIMTGYACKENPQMIPMPCQNQKQAEDLKEEFPEKSGDSGPEGESTGKENGVQRVDLSALQAQYPDVRGWLTIPGTGIDYPVLQGSEEEPEYYLKRNYKGEYDVNGSLFLQWDCPAEDGLNRIIYGHNMNSGAMFGNLDQYEDAEFRAAHRKVFFQTEKGMEEYTVVSVLKTDLSRFPFTKADFPDEVSLKEYVELAKSLEVFETGENAPECHSVLTLVTCAYEWDGARTVVIAAR